MKTIFLILAFFYTVSIVLYASYQPLNSWINTQWLWGVHGVIPVGFIAPMAIPGFVLLYLSMVTKE